MKAHSTKTSGANGDEKLGHVDDYLAIGQEAGASDIHLGVNAPPLWRLHGILQPMWPGAANLTKEETAALAEGFLTDAQKIQAGAGPDVVRLSIGIEDKDDIIADLDQALAAA